MKINQNMSALIANKQLGRTNNKLQSSIERLSSGMRINRSADDVAGMAISTKMRVQIAGLHQASRNASDGISILNTADGALNEVTSIIQRMRELSVQAANGTNNLEDLEIIQKEIDALTKEVDRIARDTEFNTKSILNGDLDRRVFTNSRSIDRIQISDGVPPGEYTLTVTQDATKASHPGDPFAGGANPAPTEIPVGAAGNVVINGVKITVVEGQSLQEVYANLRNAGERAEVNVDFTEDSSVPPRMNALTFESREHGSSAGLKITIDNQALADFLGLSDAAITGIKEAGKDIIVGDLDGDFGRQATWVTADGNRVTISSRDGFRMSFDAQPPLAGEDFGLGNGVLRFEVTKIGTMNFQIGANEGQTMDVRIPSMTTRDLGIDNIDLTTINGAGRAITNYDQALSLISETRARIGAFTNRLEHAGNSLDNKELSMATALSQIVDTNMAAEMSRFTQYNVMAQAVTSVLAQANQMPQRVLQLLQ